MTITRLALFFAVSGMIAAGGSNVLGDTITETFSFATLSGDTAERGNSIAGFDPALGTLNSVTVELNATATFSKGGDDDFNLVIYHFSIGSFGWSGSAQTNGNDTDTYQDTTIVTDPSDVPDFFGPFPLTTSVHAEKGGSTATVSSSFETETVVYDYTPASAAAPEPAASALLLLGLLTLPIFHKLRKRAQFR